MSRARRYNYQFCYLHLTDHESGWVIALEGLVTDNRQRPLFRPQIAA